MIPMEPRPLQRLPSSEVHVWFARPETIPAGHLEAYAHLESGDERERRLRLRFERHRIEHLVSVALVRTSLSRYAPVEPADWLFERNDRGRPDLVPGQCDPDLAFNLSHTRGLVACAVARQPEVGVDVEWIERRGRTTAIADRFFSRREVRDLEALPDARRRDRFFDYWTLKESYIKARGMGLAIPLRAFSFHLDEAPPIRISFEPTLEDDPSTWQFELFRPDDAHRLAVGIRRGAVADLRIDVRETLSFQGE
jgi:4'-phosphopantetheinyl transferase